MTDAQPSPSPIVQLHNHSEYSLTDGAIRIKELVKKAKSFGHSAVALTDHGNMFGAIEFFGVAKSAGIKPIIGCDLFVAGGDETMAYVVAANSSGAGSKSPSAKGSDRLGEPPAFHLPVLAKNFAGYKSLIKIVSYGFKDWQTPVPIVSTDDFDSCADELIVLSGGIKGEFAFLVSQLVTASPDPLGELVSPRSERTRQLASALKAHVTRMTGVLGKGNYYIELVDNHLAAQQLLLPYLVEFAQFFRLPLVATSDSHYLDDGDVEAHSVLTAIKNDLKMTDIRSRLSDAAFHLLSDDEMQERFGKWPEALANTGKIAEQVDIDIPFGKFYLPNFQLPNDQSPEEGLRHLSKLGLEERFKQLGITETKPYYDRLKYELDVIISMGFPGYFLIVQDFINWAKAQGIPVGPGRGSGAGSLVAYALKITDLDPLPLNLIFERFLNPDRISMPDFDVDFCQSRRDEVIRYVTDKYGTNDVAQITTFGKMKAKAVVRDVGRVLELSYGKVDKIAKLIPNELDITLSDALDKEPRLKEEMAKDEVIADLMALALKLEGISRHTSVHAAGVVISEGGMENFVPVHRTEDGTLVTQYEMKNAEKVGLVKFDFLGLKTLTVVEKAVQLVNARRKANLNIENIEIEDKKVYAEVSTGHTTALFQLESEGMQKIVAQLRPSRFEDIIAIVALYRPGPLGSGMVEDFIERKHGRQKITYPLPQLEPILSDTYGIILYQEQVQKIAATLANYTLGEADILRRAMGKKKPEEMAKQKTRFLSGCKENAIDSQIADDIFELMAKFAAYGFNKSHSAAYGLVSYQTAYMKTYYPEEFMAAIMTCDMDNTDKIVRYIEECRRMNFTILPPDINRSELDFDVPAKKTVGFALRAIKGIGENPLTLLVNERNANGPFLHLTDLAKRVPLHKVGKKTLELLVQCGAMSSFHPCRSELKKRVAKLVKFSDDHHSAKGQGQVSLFDDALGGSQEDTGLDEDEFQIPAGAIEESPLASLLVEKKLLGVFLSQHPMDLFQGDQKRFSQCHLGQLASHAGNKDVTIVAFLTDVTFRFAKKSGKKMIYYALEDNHAAIEAMTFDEGDEIPLPEKNIPVKVSLAVTKSFKGDGLNIRVNSVESLDATRSQLRHAKLTVDLLQNGEAEPSWSSAQFDRLDGILAEHPGQTKLRLALRYDRAEVNINQLDRTVALTDRLFEQLEGLKHQGLRIEF